MTGETTELLRRYLNDKSEAAFTELVQRHIDLVYSAALRQVSGDIPAAQDVTQAVFTDLARKAPRLLRHTSLSGWLYTCTRYLAAKARRAEERRRAREHRAYAMNQQLQSSNPDPAWEELLPVLDDVMHELSTADREAVLMRYFEGRPLTEVGTRLGVTENAARMRVDRALDKLRAALAKRGVTSTTAVLGGILAARAVGAAPPDLTSRVSHSAFAAGAVGGGVLIGLVAWLAAMRAEVLAGVAVVALLATGALLLTHKSHRLAAIAPSAAVSTPGSTRASTPPAAEGQEKVPTSGGPSSIAEVSNQLALEIVAGDSGKPVPGVRIEYWIWNNAKVVRTNLQATRFGLCKIPLLRDTVSHLVLVSEIDGFADTRLEWRPERGQKIPEQYTLRLARSVAIGGRVLDADGQAVAGAHVGFNNQPDPSLEGTGPQSDNFGWPFWITATTDDEGRWRIDRIAKETMRTIYGSASHTQHVQSDLVFAARDAKAEKQLLDGAYVFRLGHAVAVRGLVQDPDGKPVPEAHVLVGHVGESGSRETATQPDGSFSVAGCKPGKNLLTADAKGFAATTMDVELKENTEDIRITLQPGRVLRLRVVNSAGEPIPKANVWLNPFDHGPIPIEPRKPAPAQVEFNRKSGADGRLEWDSAPDQDLKFSVTASGYMRLGDVKVRPDGQEHLITLSSALTISGTVRDDSNGRPIPRFRIVTGWPERGLGNDATNPRWSTIDRFWLTFDGGNFRHVYEEPVLGGQPNPEFVFKFEAEGYASSVTRVVRAEEKEARFDIALLPVKATVVTVLSPEGRPIALAEIGLVSKGAMLRLAPGGFGRDNIQSGGSLLVADAQGQFKLPADGVTTRVIAAHAEGYAEVAVTALADEPTIRLQPWGSLEGTYFSGRKPAAGRDVLFQYESGDFNSVSSDFTAYKVRTDDEGRFRLPQVPPGKHKLMRLLEQKTAHGMVWTHMPLVDVDIVPGAVTQVTVGVSNCAVTARLGWSPDLKRETNWEVHAVLRTPLPLPQAPADTRTDPQAFVAWRARPEIKAAFASTRYFPLPEGTDGALTAEDVPPGDYILMVTVLEPLTAGAPAKTHAKAEVPITVPADSALGVLDIGEIVLKPTP